ncbi:hypothetical protein EX895_002054 [Sporisorium graminicola]|uniref:Uncharacterized protein n=1 Tax=Sporisorium graminicola TaxID=280036 RepID=A0A4U7KW25_9BASI|nr:hypothetical protein EX895_002054 [Sporisorium graminicola]TKY88813.1 hypothetical protein EX895_002054 [Sporisorium graminicola]
MSSSDLLQRLRCWALTLSVAVVAAVIFHSVQIYPWYRLFLAESQPWYLERMPPAAISQQGPCFLPKSAASESPQSEAVAPIGSSREVGSNQHICFHYASRFEPYLAEAWGNTYMDKTQVRLGLQDKAVITNDLLWYANLLAEHDPLQYPHVDWSKLSPSQSCTANQNGIRPNVTRKAEGTKSRTAIVLRLYQHFKWTQDAVLHLRALVWELRTADLPFNVDVHLLLEVKDAASHVAMFSASGRKTILRGSVPIEFWPMVSLWSEKEMTLRYPLYGDFRAGIDAAGSYRGCLLALQRFAVEHSEYDSVVNWEMDTRFTHTYDRLLDSIHTYAYQKSGQTYARWPVQGGDLDSSSKPGAACENKTADVIVFSPVRDPRGSGWYWEYDVQGYPSMRSTPRAASVGTNLWLSRRAVLALENVTANQHQSFFCEAMAPSLVFVPTDLASEGRDDLCAEQIKLVHYPHPVAFKYEASPAKLDQLLNPPRAALSKYHEEAPKDTSYYYTSTIAGKIYTRWQSQVDACIQPLLLHPIKSHSVLGRFRATSNAIWAAHLIHEGKYHSSGGTLNVLATSAKDPGS